MLTYYCKLLKTDTFFVTHSWIRKVINKCRSITLLFMWHLIYWKSLFSENILFVL